MFCCTGDVRLLCSPPLRVCFCDTRSLSRQPPVRAESRDSGPGSGCERVTRSEAGTELPRLSEHRDVTGTGTQ